MVLPRLVRQALADEPVTVYGDGTQRRCFSYVGDVVGALVRLSEHPGAVGQIFNVGSTEEISILQLAQRVIQLTNSASTIRFVPYEVAYEAGFEDMERRIPDLTKIQSLIGYQATVTLDQIILQVIEHFREAAARTEVAAPVS
jgi:UDP-glucose 4-epimerase